MSERWFRVYVGLVDDPKVQRLPPPTFRALVNLWCLAAANGGRLPSLGDIAFKLRMSVAATRQLLALLIATKLLDQHDGGISPHNWGGRQFILGERQERPKTTSTDRVRRHRAKVKRVSETRETPPESEAKTETNDTATARAEPVNRSPQQQVPFLLPIDGSPAPAIRKPDVDRLEAALREAAGSALNSASPGLLVLADPLRWLGSGCDLELDILPALRAVAMRPATKPGAVRVWNYFSPAVFEARDRRNAASPSPVIDIGNQRTKGRPNEDESPTRRAIRLAREGG